MAEAATTPTPPAPAPAVTVLLPPALIALFPGAEGRVSLSAATVGEAVDGLDARWPGMRARLCQSPGRLRRHINVFVAGERAAFDTPLRPGAEMAILLAVCGG